MSREAEQKLVAFVTQRIGAAAVAQRLSISEQQLERLVTGRDWLSQEQTLKLADLVIEVANKTFSRT